ncbi:luciferin sulfotransferase-like [Stomoxys calcitrans]|uniref:luciferin sulfotransferase-like n=1 Tax=Stomoxys calcitrans TaxID=35570 RepID=UPI0027E29189|nr:luciferin sulfotransferase-like [Stomoxys calcitrans]
MFISRLILSASCKNHSSMPMKVYAAEGPQIPLKKNWLDSWCALPASFEAVAKAILNYEIRSDDVFCLTYMKSGTTWMQEAVWLLLNNLDYEKSKAASLSLRSPFLELEGVHPNIFNTLDMVKNLERPRVIKTHLPANLMPQQIWVTKPKIIYLARNCKDVVVSTYHFMNNLGYRLDYDFENFVNDFMNNEIWYTSYWSHVLDYWKMRHEPYILFMTYEEMQRDLKGVLQKLCTFLERPQLKPDEMEKMLEHLSFEKMKANNQINATQALKNLSTTKEEFQFLRRGVVGSYKDEMSPALQAKIDKWSSEFLAQHGLTEEDIFGKF